MARGATRRAWVKLFITGWLHGSIRWQLEAEERSVWADLICMAGECGQGGLIADSDGCPLPWSFIANRLNIPEELLERTIAKCKHEERLETCPDDTLKITNWSAYQSEYERQKPHRKTKKNAHKGIYGEFSNVFLTDDEYEKLKTKFGDTLPEKIENLSQGIESKGYKYNSHYATILNWDRRDKGKEGAKNDPDKYTKGKYGHMVQK